MTHATKEVHLFFLRMRYLFFFYERGARLFFLSQEAPPSLDQSSTVCFTEKAEGVGKTRNVKLDQHTSWAYICIITDDRTHS